LTGRPTGLAIAAVVTHCPGSRLRPHYGASRSGGRAISEVGGGVHTGVSSARADTDQKRVRHTPLTGVGGGFAWAGANHRWRGGARTAEFGLGGGHAHSAERGDRYVGLRMDGDGHHEVPILDSLFVEPGINGAGASSSIHSPLLRDGVESSSTVFFSWFTPTG